MEPAVRESLAEQLRTRRAQLLREVSDVRSGIATLTEERESELEEEAQEEAIARQLAQMDDRGRREIEAIATALDRIAEGTYGLCTNCGEPIPVARLQALPTATLCVDCAREREGSAEPEPEESESPRGHVPPDLELLSDDEIEARIREQIQEDGRVDMQGVELRCRDGAVHLEGTVPSEPEHRILLKIITDIVGLEEVVDQLRVDRWEREDLPAHGHAPAGGRSAQTEDSLEGAEEDADQEPPQKPPPDEE